jgi:hypothetical protein
MSCGVRVIERQSQPLATSSLGFLMAVPSVRTKKVADSTGHIQRLDPAKSGRTLPFRHASAFTP